MQTSKVINSTTQTYKGDIFISALKKKNHKEDICIRIAFYIFVCMLLVLIHFWQLFIYLKWTTEWKNEYFKKVWQYHLYLKTIPKIHLQAN